MKFRVAIFVVFPIAIAAFIFWLKVSSYGVAIVPKHIISSWQVEVHVKVKGKGRSGTISLQLPVPSDRYEVMSENFISNGFAVALFASEDSRKAVWSGVAKEHEYDFFYRAQIQLRKSEVGAHKLKEEYISNLSADEGRLVEGLLVYLKKEGMEGHDLIEDLMKEVLKGNRTESIKLRSGLQKVQDKANLLVNVLRYAGFPARVVHGIELSKPERTTRFLTWADVSFEGHWLAIDVRKARMKIPSTWFGWRRSPAALIDSRSMRDVDAVVSVSPDEITRVKFNGKGGALSWFLSLQHMPVEAQALYRILLVIPVGALVVALIRSIIGIRTLGTFMPVLIALSFRETELLWGLSLYATIVVLSLIARYCFEHLQLLVVPRLTATMTLVVTVILIFSSVMNHFGINKGISVALFPIVILTMMIERISIIVEELGLMSALKQTVISLAVAALVYLVISNKHVQFYMFTFPELLLVIFSISVLLGRFTGYRLTELYRFRSLLKS